jgi:hypothetical protein
MPVWSYLEVKDCRENIFKNKDQKDVEFLYEHYGGIPRSIFESDGRSIADLDNAIKKANPLMVNKYIGESDKDEETSSKVLHIMVDRDFKKERVVFASRYVQKRIYVLAELDQLKNLAFKLQAKSNMWSLNKADGPLFEYNMHNVLTIPNKYNMRLLRKGILRDDTIDNYLTIKKTEITVYKTTDQTIDVSFYYIPESMSFPTIDSFVHDKVFSITFNKSHSLNLSEEFAKVVELIQTANQKKYFDFVYMTAPSNYPLFELEGEPAYHPHKGAKNNTQEALNRMKALKENLDNNANIYVAECDFQKHVFSNIQSAISNYK